MNDIFFSIITSIKIVTISTLLSIILGSFINFLLFIAQPTLKKLILAINILPLVLPPTVTGFFLLSFLGKGSTLGNMYNSVFNSHIVFSTTGAVIAVTTISTPLFVYTVYSAINNINKKIIYSSYLFGHSKLSTFKYIIFPIIKPSILAAVILTFSRGLGEFGATLMVAGNISEETMTIPLSIYSSTIMGDYNQANILSLFITITSILIVFTVSKNLELKDA